MLTFEDFAKALPVGISGGMIRHQDGSWSAKFWTRRPGEVVDDFTIVVRGMPGESASDVAQRGFPIARDTWIRLGGKDTAETRTYPLNTLP
jgi:hypothetical protein